jgi:peptide/nickel transport system substrate-binding protein
MQSAFSYFADSQERGAVMLRGFRWQLLALLLSIVIFGLALGLKFFNTPEPQATALPSEIASTTIPPTITPLPTQAPAAVITNIPQDTIMTYSEGLIGSIQRLNPLLIASQAERDITSLIFEGLTEINQYGEPVGVLADSWLVSRDGYEYVLLLRQDVLWQDGLQFTADDVIFTYRLLANPDYPFTEIGRFWQTVEVEKLGDFMLRFRLAQPLASFPTLLTTGILPEHALRGISAEQLVSHPFNLTPIGTGAYQLEALRGQEKIEIVDLRVAPTFRQRVEGQSGYAIERMRFRLYDNFDAATTALANSEIDGLAARMMSERLPLLEINRAEIYTDIEAKLGILIFNWNEGEETRFFNDSRVRTGLQLGLNRNRPVESSLLNQAVVADSPLLLNSWAYIGNLWTDPNPNRALELFDNANIQIPEGADIGESRFKFTILTPDDPALMRLAQEIATQWSEFNLDVTVEAVGADIYLQRLETGDFQAALVELPLGADPDIFAYWHVDQYPDGLNYGAANDTRMSELLERARQENNGLSRVQLYRDFQRRFVSQAVAIPLYYPLYTYAVNRNVNGVQLGFISESADRFRTLQDWIFATE